MNRKKFIESHGATCRNWTWSWSFVNHKEKFVIFGAFDVVAEADSQLLMSKSWSHNKNGRKAPGYSQSLEHIKLIEGGYSLRTFIQKHGGNDTETGKASIKGFIRTLEEKELRTSEDSWYAIPKQRNKINSDRLKK